MENKEYIHEPFFSGYKIFWFVVYFLMLSGSFFISDLAFKIVYGKSGVDVIADSGIESKEFSGKKK